ncbi:hypothetical protein RHGRI_001250 [Rhododendron griersonianum]|uniref:Uncharacterized protein n=1 Tax=Rhododendron griersonianum TaxID=479676 RepID=A0AAV6LKK1_9ERIC|nr:hypothetical protein RHGRI_001250 [Rhododendron griersonianum]
MHEVYLILLGLSYVEVLEGFAKSKEDLSGLADTSSTICSLLSHADNDSAEDETNHDGNSEMNYVKSFKGFRLLNACR